MHTMPCTYIHAQPKLTSLPFPTPPIEQKLVVLDPKGRISAKAALYHRLFDEVDKQQFLQ